jgi:cell division protein FtsB
MRVANTYWVDERIRAQRVFPRATSFGAVREISAELVGSKVETRRRGLVPSWVIFGMVLLATFAVCVTVNMRTRSKLLTASEQFALIQTDVAMLRTINRSLEQEVEEIRNNPRTIEAAARSRLNMVRGNEIVVPLE